MKTITFFILFFVLALISNVNAQVISFVEYGANSPVVSLTSDDPNDTICVGNTVVFTTPFQSSTQYTFEVDGVIFQGPAISNNYLDTTLVVGDHEIVLTADNGSCSLTDTLIFVVLALPTPTLISDAPGNTTCDGVGVEFTATGGIQYDFRVNGISMQAGLSDTYLTSALVNGDLVDVVVGNAGGCSAISAGITMTINSLPTPTLISDAPGNAICDGVGVEFTATGGVQYDFRVNGISMQAGLSDTYLTSALVDGDLVDAVVTNTNGCSATSAQITMTVYSLPSITSISYSSAYSAATAECVGNMVDVTLNGMSGSSPYIVRIYNDAGGSPGTLFYTVPGTVSGPVGTFQKPVYGVGANIQYYQLQDQNGCLSFPNP